MTGGRSSPQRPATYRQVFAVAEFRSLWYAQVLSLLGDQLAQVALAVLVYQRTGSAVLTALAYALTYLPAIIGGPLLSGLADLFPRRQVMIITDLVRAALVAVMALPQTPFWGMCVLLFFVYLLGAPFSAARAATLPDVLPGDRYVVGSAVANTTFQASQVIGFFTGGALVALVGAHQALGIDAATFVVSALLLRLGVRHRPSLHSGGRARPSLFGATWAGVRLVFGDNRLRMLVAFAWLSGFYVVPEGLASPYGLSIGGATTVGILMAAMPLGTVIGALVLTRFVPPERRLDLVGPLALLACAPLIVSVFHPGLVLTFILWTLSGFGGAYQLAANAAFMRSVPAAGRGQAFGVAQSGLLAAQGAGILLAGVVADASSPQWAVTIFGAAGLVVALVLAARWRVVRPQISPLHDGGEEDAPSEEGAAAEPGTEGTAGGPPQPSSRNGSFPPDGAQDDQRSPSPGPATAGSD